MSQWLYSKLNGNCPISKHTMQNVAAERFLSASVKLPNTHLADMEDGVHAQLKVRLQQQ